MNDRQPPSINEGSPSFIMALIGFCNPPLGLILWLVLRHDAPRKARSIRNGFLTLLAIDVAAIIFFVLLEILFLILGE